MANVLILILTIKIIIAKIIIRAFSNIKPAIWGPWDRWTPKSELVSKAMYTTKILCSRSRVVAIKFFFLNQFDALIS